MPGRRAKQATEHQWACVPVQEVCCHVECGPNLVRLRRILRKSLQRIVLERPRMLGLKQN